MIYKVPLELVVIDGDGYHLAVNILMGSRSVRLIVDTGASKTALDLTRLPDDGPVLEENEEFSAGLGTSEMQSFFTTVHDLRLGELHVPAWETVVLDLSHINLSYERLDLPPADGVLGSDFLKHYQATIDYRKWELRLFVDGRKK